MNSCQALILSLLAKWRPTRKPTRNRRLNERASRCHLPSLLLAMLLGINFIGCQGSDSSVGGSAVSKGAEGQSKEAEKAKEATTSDARPKNVVMVFATPSSDVLEKQETLENYSDKQSALAKEDAVSLFVEACKAAPKKGYNPALDYPRSLVAEAKQEMLVAFASGDIDARRCLASALARYPKPKELHKFWREQLESDDLQLRWWAIIELATIGDTEDVENVLRQVVEAPEVASLLPKQLRHWKDPRVVPYLHSMATDSDPLSSKRARESLTKLGFEDVLEAGASAYEEQFKWWTKFRASIERDESLKHPWEADATLKPKA